MRGREFETIMLVRRIGIDSKIVRGSGRTKFLLLMVAKTSKRLDGSFIGDALEIERARAGFWRSSKVNCGCRHS